MSFVIFSITDNVILLLSKDLYNSIILHVYAALLIFLPVTGWISDSLLGRYRAINASSFLTVVACLAMILSFVMLQFDWTLPALVLMYIAMPVTGFSSGKFFISSLPFIIDQMIKASADDIIAGTAGLLQSE